MSQSVIEKARELAGIIALSPEYITMRATQDAAAQDETLAAALSEYNELHRRIEEISLQKEPDFDQMDALTRELEEVQEKVRVQPMYQALQQSRKAFSAMMAQVNAELSAVLNPNGGQGGCSGNCSGCSGCS